MGYLECINEVGRFLGSLEIDDIELRTKIIEHLANSVAGARQEQTETEVTSSGIAQTPTLIRPRPEKPGAVVMGNGSDVSISNSVINLAIPQLSKAISFGVNFSTADANSTVINSDTHSSFRTGSIQPLSNIQSGQISTSKLAKVSNERLSFIDEKQHLPSLNPVRNRVCDNIPCDNQSKSLLMTQSEANLKLSGKPSATTISPNNSTQIFGGLQLLPTQLPSGDIVFIVPTNILPANQSTSYVIPVLSPKTMTSTAQTQSTIVQPIGTPISDSNVLPTYEPLFLRSVPTVTSREIGGSKSVIATSADHVSSSQLTCDTNQSDSSKPIPAVQFSSNQNVYFSSPMTTFSPQSLKPLHNIVPKSTELNLGLPDTKSHIINDFVSPMKMFFYSDPSATPDLLKSTSFPNHTNTVPQLSLSSTNINAHVRDISSPPQLVLNLSMQNRTRAEEAHHARSNFPDEDENVWRPW